MNCKLSEVCSYANEKVPTQSLTNRTYISTENMLPNMGGITSASSMPTLNAVTRIRQDDILLSNIRPYFQKMILADFEGGCSNDVLVLRVDKNKVLPEYLYYSLAHKGFFDYVTKTGKGTKMPRGDKTAIMQYEINVPNITAQKRIATILSSLDKKVKSNNHTNDNLEKQGSLLVDDYFSKCLDEVSLSSILSFANGFAFSSKDYLESGKYKIVTIKNVQDGKIDPAGASCLNEIPERMNKDCELKVGDILLSLTGNVGRVGAVCDGNLLLNQRVAKIIPNNSAILPLLYFIFRQDSMKNTLEAKSKGTAKQNLSPVETLKLKIKFDIEKAGNYSAILEPILNKIIENNIENRRLTKLRDTLLPELLNGKIDVSNIDI